MNAYISLVRVRFTSLLQYRAAAIAGMSTQLFWGLIRMMIFEAFYALNTKQQPLSREQMISYVWLGQALLGLLPWGIDAELKEKIRSGGVVYDLLRPLDLYFHWYCRAIAARTAPTLLRSIPLFIIAGMFFGLKAPAGVGAAIGWLGLTLLALLLNCAFMNIVTISMLWTVSSEGINRLAPPIVYALSGMMIPLQFYPAPMQPLLHILPFRDMVGVPFRVYVGTIPFAAIAPYALQSFVWTVILIACGRLLLHKGVRNLVAQGG
jgi:ABC-2 type transport system permease protein